MPLEIPSFVNPTERISLSPCPGYPSDSLYLEESKLIHTGDHIDVYRAVARDPPSKCDGDVVYKVAYGAAVARLYHEAKIYRKLDRIQGERVPRCYGYFQEAGMACLVLQYCGETRPEAFIDLPYNRKYVISTVNITWLSSH